ncbi:unnamed protein product, partial [Brugia pahangi]|uniref:Hyp13 n=1 Tax=Brugia pahangi TaxID=6280 RepID=A0A0N4TLY2_BRUPA
PDIYTKLANQNATRPKCFYNDRYQYLFNQYYVNSTHNDVCLLHFIDSSTINDISTTSSKNGLIFHSYPGNGFHPIDFSYTFLENNTCTYVEVEISTATIKRSVDCFNEKFNTNYMPLKVFVCSCSLRKDGNYCDQKLETEIANRAERFPKELLTKCIKYEAKGAEVKRNELVYVRHTSYCFIEASLIIDLEYGIKVLVKGNGVTRQIAEASKRNFNHIAFSIGTETQFCKTYLADEVFLVGACFCRTYDISAPACNSDPKMISMAKRMLIIERTNHYVYFTSRLILKFNYLIHFLYNIQI